MKVPTRPRDFRPHNRLACLPPNKRESRQTQTFISSQYTFYHAYSLRSLTTSSWVARHPNKARHFLLRQPRPFSLLMSAQHGLASGVLSTADMSSNEKNPLLRTCVTQSHEMAHCFRTRHFLIYGLVKTNGRQHIPSTSQAFQSFDTLLLSVTRLSRPTSLT